MNILHLASPSRTITILIFLAANFGNIAFAQDSLSGAYSESPKIRGSTIKVQLLSPSTADINVSLSSLDCGGELSGTAKVEGNRLTLTKDTPQVVCTLVVEVRNKTASVLSEDGCFGYHGAACSFTEQAVNLPWRKELTSKVRL